jgi:peptidoglycan/LPS O-acetylase OafA/YrhL
MDTRIVRCVAVLLIANSHLTDFYPIPQLAGDGLLGNSLFFLLSGFGLAMGDRKGLRPAGDWFSRRLLKIYPSVAIVLAFTAVYDFPALRIDRAVEIPWGLVWPIRYPFVRQITTFYLIYFVWSRTRLAAYPVALIVGLIPVYAIWRHLAPEATRTHAVHWVYYFQMLLLGVAVARTQTQRPRLPKNFAAFALPVAFLTYVGTKFVLSRAGEAEEKVYLLHMLALPVLLLILYALSDARLIARIDRFPMISRFVDWLSGATFEVYLVHYLILELEWVRSLPLPANLVVFGLGTFVAAYALQLARDAFVNAARTLGATCLKPMKSRLRRTAVESS